MCFFRLERRLLDYLVVLRIEDLLDVLFMLYMYYVVGEVFLVCLVNVFGKDVFLEEGSVIGEVVEVELYVLVFYLMREVCSMVESGIEGILLEVFIYL